MKIQASLVLLATAAHGFAPLSRPQRLSFVQRMADTSTEPTVSDFASAMPDASDPYKRLGVSQEKVALGVDAKEILQWLGTRDEIVEKIMRDNKSFTQERAELEVDKFLMDAEMMSAYINYEKKKASGSLRQEADANQSNPSFWSTYGVWFIGFFAFNYFRKLYIDPKFASGEWEGIHINLPFSGGGGGEVTDAVTTSMTETTIQTLASVQSAIDTISDAI